MRRIAALFLVSLFSSALIAQSGNAALTGFIQDSSKAFIPGVKVVAVDTDTDRRFEAITGKDGSYNIGGLSVGHYRMEVDKPGFKTILRDDMFLHVQDTLQINFQMAVGSTSESVTVDGTGVNMNTRDGSVSTVVDRKFVENIPLNGRSFQDLISMTPGVVTQSPQTSQAAGQSGDFSVNGQRTESNYYMVDGVSANISSGAANGGPQAGTSGAIGATTALGTTQSLVSVDALQEFRVSSSSYSAEYGRSPGGQFSLQTRSGTKAFHGSAFDYLRNNYFDANNWFNDHYGIAPSALRQNDFGGTLGGPMLLPGSFAKAYPSYFFVSYEGLRLTQPQAATIQYVPSIALRQAAPAALQPILNAFPLPSAGGITYSSGLAQFIQGYSLPSKIDSTSVRLDDTLTSRLHLFFRFSDTPSSTNSRTLSSLTVTTFKTQTYTIGATSQFTDKATNEFRIGYSRNDATSTASLDSFGGATPINFGSLLGNVPSGPSTSDADLYFAGTGEADLSVSSSANQGRQWNVVDTFGLSLGKHQLKFGYDYRHIKSPLYPAAPYVSGIFYGQASIINNLADLAILEKLLPSTPIFNETAAFVQDEWSVKPQLTISGGLRWEVNPPPTGANGNDAFTLEGNRADPGSLTVAPRGTPLWRTSWLNLAPRLGVAWTAHNQHGWETVLRTGGGVFFDTGSQLAALGFEYLGFNANKSYTSFAFPATAQQLAFEPSTTPPYTSTVIAFPEHMQQPYTLQWNLSVQQALGAAQSFTLSYVGSNGRRLLQEQQSSIAKLNPNFGYIEFITSGPTSSYQALQAQFQRSVSHGIEVLASYTWSHSLDFGSANAALPLVRGNSDYDLRNNFQGGVTWELPTNYSNAGLRALASGWGVDSRLTARSSFPITLRGSLTTNPATGQYYYGNLNVVQGQPLYLYGSQYPGGTRVNPAAFQKPAANNLGNAGRNFVRGFGDTQVNLALHRTFPLVKGSTLQFRAEAFNLLNHPIFGLVDSTLTDLTFGQATKTLNQSLSTLSSQYQQGGPRSLQFALKIQF
ncbi:TonB-dependent receptor [Terriglobus saanensis]|uniref:TonB-dependent receptor plug n=1 Tax=Terriglobus saanensis (strain ATCC BAA-1853 / DSM 23119 / SP1PR4) TaxID=401053 RepID=E8UZN5_TERSS|nr:carboxypeptidase regulatory-like domain-containing protein [Terriglobus saanensis]ADV84378.1 TonB-dependent receptor plug [Terriglobus saanensis SP1PR4]